MEPDERERLREDAPKRAAEDKTGVRVMGSFGAFLTFAMLLALSIIVIIWWLAR